jgi:hypothetical protein
MLFFLNESIFNNINFSFISGSNASSHDQNNASAGYRQSEAEC